jgi:hypothetical protein
MRVISSIGEATESKSRSFGSAEKRFAQDDGFLGDGDEGVNLFV